jgi:hypothetical protein
MKHVSTDTFSKKKNYLQSRTCPSDQQRVLFLLNCLSINFLQAHLANESSVTTLCASACRSGAFRNDCGCRGRSQGCRVMFPLPHDPSSVLISTSPYLQLKKALFVKAKFGSRMWEQAETVRLERVLANVYRWTCIVNSKVG